MSGRERKIKKKEREGKKGCRRTESMTLAVSPLTSYNMTQIYFANTIKFLLSNFDDKHTER